MSKLTNKGFFKMLFKAAAEEVGLDEVAKNVKLDFDDSDGAEVKSDDKGSIETEGEEVK